MIKKRQRASVRQVSAIPYRSLDQDVEICLITSRRSGRWGFPKGTLDAGESAADAALREAREEAGLTGRIVGPAIGCYQCVKARRLLRVEVRLMEVTAVRKRWPEADQRRRCWLPMEQALRRLCRKPLRNLLKSAARRIESPVHAGVNR